MIDISQHGDRCMELGKASGRVEGLLAAYKALLLANQFEAAIIVDAEMTKAMADSMRLVAEQRKEMEAANVG